MSVSTDECEALAASVGARALTAAGGVTVTVNVRAGCEAAAVTVCTRTRRVTGMRSKGKRNALMLPASIPCTFMRHVPLGINVAQ